MPWRSQRESGAAPAAAAALGVQAHTTALCSAQGPQAAPAALGRLLPTHSSKGKRKRAHSLALVFLHFGVTLMAALGQCRLSEARLGNE